MIFEILLVCAGTSAVASVMNVLMNRKDRKDSLSLKKYMPGDLPVITLSANNVPLNFLLDTGSNISHICPSALELITKKVYKGDYNTEVAGLGAVTKGVSMCEVSVKDTLNKEYTLHLSVSEQLEETTRYIEKNTGVAIHGLLGTDFLQKYQYVIDFKSLEVYTKK